MKVIVVAGFLVLAAFFTSEVFPSKASRVTIKPPDGMSLLAIGQDIASIESYLNAFDKSPAGLMAYTSISGLEGVFEPADYGAGVQHADRLTRDYPGKFIQLGLYMVGSLTQAADGVYDSHIDTLGQWIQQNDQPVFLRIGYEFDFPDNQYNPREYTRAWRHIADRLASRGVTNVNYVWHSYAGPGSERAEAWYPGDEYVDWVGLSYFKPSNGSEREYIAQIARDKNKPLMVAEAAPYGIGVHRGAQSRQWFAEFFEFCADQNVKMISYISADWENQPLWKGQNWGDSRVHANPDMKSFWEREISKKKYLGSTFK